MFRRIGQEDACWCGSGKKYCDCHMGFDRKVSRARFMGHEVPSHRIIKTPAQIEGKTERGCSGSCGRADKGRGVHSGDRPLGV